VKDYYKTLGVDRTATPDQIKQAYRRLASLHHPDKGGDTAQFQEIQEAYATLSDDAKRSVYDRGGNANNTQFHSGPGFDFDAIFNIFGADLRGQRRSTPRMELWISLEDVALGGARTLSMQADSTVTNIEINIPPGIQNSDTVRYPGLAPGGQDLIIVYRIKPHAMWQTDGINIVTERVVDIWDLVLGTSITIRDLLGKELLLTVPPETQPGSLLRARGLGLPARQLPGDRMQNHKGDLLVRIKGKISTPVDQNIIEAIRKSRA
jgi:DnaJ-class molecular chaperone